MQKVRRIFARSRTCLLETCDNESFAKDERGSLDFIQKEPDDHALGKLYSIAPHGSYGYMTRYLDELRPRFSHTSQYCIPWSQWVQD